MRIGAKPDRRAVAEGPRGWISAGLDQRKGWISARGSLSARDWSEQSRSSARVRSTQGLGQRNGWISATAGSAQRLDQREGWISKGSVNARAGSARRLDQRRVRSARRLDQRKGSVSTRAGSARRLDHCAARSLRGSISAKAVGAKVGSATHERSHRVRASGRQDVRTSGDGDRDGDPLTGSHPRSGERVQFDDPSHGVSSIHARSDLTGDLPQRLARHDHSIGDRHRTRG
jgi:adhesin HecA-like repeat protein